MYLTLLPSISPLDIVNCRLTQTCYDYDPRQTTFDPTLLIFNKILPTHYSLNINNYLRCFQFHEVAHLVLEGDDYGDIPQKYIRPIIRLALEKFISYDAFLLFTNSTVCEEPLEMHKLTLTRGAEQRETSLLFFPPGSIELADWVVGQPLDPHRNYASLSAILLPIFKLVPWNRKTVEFFVSDEIHSILLRITHFPEGPNIGMHVCAHLFEDHSVRASILSVLVTHAAELKTVVGARNHFSALAGALPEKPQSVVGGDLRCMLDFDLYTIERNEELWQYFLDWKSIGERQALQTVLVGADISARSGSFLRRHLPWRSPFPSRRVCDADLAILSPSTRPKDPIAALLLEDDHDFIFRLDEPMKTGPERYSQTYFGHASILGKSSGRLCLKLFDERLFHVVPADEEDLLGRPVSSKYRVSTFNTAEDMARREEAAYDVLSYLQGSLLPYSYGFHYFRLPDGHECLGFVMEAVRAVTDFEPDLDEWSQERQIDLIKLIRTAFRAVRYAGVFQTDWHWGQFLFTNQPNPQFVLIDFAFALQYPCLCHTPHPPSYRDDWLQVRNLLNGSGVEHAILDKYWLKRDEYEH